jgi:hypothetical protein
MGRTIQGDHPDHRRGLQDPATPQGDDDGGTPGQTGAIPRDYSKRAAKREEQCYGITQICRPSVCIFVVHR